MNIASVSWADHLTFGEGDGRLDTPDRIERRIRAWRDELGARALHWRVLRARIPGRFSAARGYRHPSQTAAQAIVWDDFNDVPALAHAAGLEAWLYVSLFDEGWPLPPARVRVTSYHNAMHGRHVAWQSELTRAHPEWLAVDRSGKVRQEGVVSLAYPQARHAFVERWGALLDGTSFDGLFICLRSQSQPAAAADQFGFNDPARADFRARHGVDPARESFDVQAWRDLLGGYLTALLSELRQAVGAEARKVGVGVTRGDVMGPPLGNSTVQWRAWMENRLLDDLVIGQNSTQCPSMWHQLWPMHRGSGYVESQVDVTDYASIAARTGTRLFVARQWCERNEREEREILAIPGVTGLVFSTFRHDNPAAIARGDWRAGSVLERQQPHR
jgi:hypothetical protein